MVLDSERVYWANDGSLRALSLADGSPVWERRLTGPESSWQVALTDQCVLVYPNRPAVEEAEGEGLALVFRPGIREISFSGFTSTEHCRKLRCGSPRAVSWSPRREGSGRSGEPAAVQGAKPGP